MKIKITERRIATWNCTKCPANIGGVEGSIGKMTNVKIICPDCHTPYCLHWGFEAFETWVEEWETYTKRHEQREKG